jgi:prolyl oligopeptidase
MNRLIAAATGFLAPSLALAAAFAGVEVPPPPAPRPVYDTHWGVRIEDPYRFLETTTDPEVQKYMRAQADATTAILAKIPGRDSLLARIREIDEATPASVNSVVRDDRGGIFYLKREAKDNQFKLYRRESPASAEVLLVDPEVESKAAGTPHAISEFAPSRDGRFVAYAMSAGGAEIGTLRVIETATGKEVTPRIDRIRGGSPSWLPDGSGFFYSRLAEGYESRPRAERFLDEKTWFRRLAEPGKDFAVFGAGMHFEVGIERAAGAFLVVTPGHDHVAAIVLHGVDPNVSVYLAELPAVLEGKPRWRKIIGRGDQVSRVAAGGGWLYAMTARDAPRFRVVAMKLASPDISDVRTVIAAGDEVVVGMAASSEGLYVTRRRGAVKELLRIAHAEGSAPQRIALPFEGNVNVVDAQSHRPGAVLTLGGWTRATRHYAIGPGDEAPTPLPLAPQGKYDSPANLVSREVRVKSHDGVEVPVSIVSRADAKLDGGNPAMLYGYGAYGIVEDPAFNPRLLAWLEAGGVFAVAHVRGGGILGDGWRRAGWKTTKHNTWKDGIAAAEWLVANGYTAPNRLAIYGGSAGGIFVGRAITERPDLFSAAVIAVGNTDSLRSETRANGVGNIPEYGTFTREDEFRGLLAMSPYANVKPGTGYPAVMFEHGVNDSRVDVWMTLKTGARFAAATTSGKPVLMRLEFESGHGPGATRAQSQATTADRWAFMLWQARDARFQPSP